MTPQEQELILSVANRLRQAPVATKDVQAEELIQREIGAQTDAAYLLTQAVILQEHALKQAQERITTMESELQQARQQTSAQGRGGFLGGLFGGGNPTPTAASPSPSRGIGPAPGQAAAPTSGFGDFMRGAASVAVGVAGGHLLFSGLSGLFAGDEPAASPEATADGAFEPDTDTTQLAQSDYASHASEPDGFVDQDGFDSFDMGDDDF